MKSLSLLALPLILLGCTETLAPVTHSRVSHDVVDSYMSSTQSKAFFSFLRSKESECDAQIRKAACLTVSHAPGFSESCSTSDLDESEIEKLIALKNRLPEFHQKVMCHLDRLQIHEHVDSIGYAGRIYDRSGARPAYVGNFIGLRRTALAEKINPNIWTWKEQLNFGLADKDDKTFQISPLGPRVVETTHGQADDLLHVMVHELSHVIDHINDVTKEECIPEANAQWELTGMKCTTPPGSYAALSWPVGTFHFKWDESLQYWSRSEEELAAYPYLTQLCYYDCKETLDLGLLPKIIGELKRSSFFSLYSIFTRVEDFAEASTNYVLKSEGFIYEVFGPDGTLLFSSAEAFKSERMKPKLQWLERFYSQGDLKYKL